MRCCVLQSHAARVLYVTLNSDDPPVLGTILTDEYLAIARIFGLGR